MAKTVFIDLTTHDPPLAYPDEIDAATCTPGRATAPAEQDPPTRRRKHILYREYSMSPIWQRRPPSGTQTQYCRRTPIEER